MAAVRRRVAIGAVGSAWRPALGQVWKFLGKQPGLRTDGHNIFLYHHPTDRDAPMNVDFGVEVTRALDRSGEVYATETPAGEVGERRICRVDCLVEAALNAGTGWRA